MTVTSRSGYHHRSNIHYEFQIQENIWGNFSDFNFSKFIFLFQKKFESAMFMLKTKTPRNPFLLCPPHVKSYRGG